MTTTLFNFILSSYDIYFRYNVLVMFTIMIITSLIIYCELTYHDYFHVNLQNYIYEYCFTSLSAQSWQYRDRRKPEVGTMPYSYFE